MEKFIIDSIQEIFLFDLVEMIFLLLFYLAETKKKINKLQFTYTLGIMTILDFTISALNLPGIIQIVFTILLAIYLQKFFQINFIKNTIIIIKWFIVMCFDSFYIFIFNSLFSIQLISMSNNFLKFLFVLPDRLIELLILYILLFYKGGGFLMKKDKKITFIGTIIRRKLQK